MKKMWIGCAVGLLACAASAGKVDVAVGGVMNLVDLDCTFRPVAFDTQWHGFNGAGGYRADKKGVYSFTLQNWKKTHQVPASVVFRPLKDGRLSACYAFNFDKDVELNGLVLSTTMNLADYGGGTIGCAERAVQIPVLGVPGKQREFFNGAVTNLFVKNAQGKVAFELAFDRPTQVMAQDNRQWNNDNFSIRITAHGNRKGRVYAKGETFTSSFVMSMPGGVDFSGGDFILKPGADWVPLHVKDGIIPGSALDFSKIRNTEAPAGRHGWVVCKGQDFEFENLPGVSQRFYGVNICGDANIPDYETAKKFAAHLARMGYNALRFHHHDSCLVRGSKDGTTLNPEMMKRFDGLMAACIENGIYMTTDLFVSRRPIKYRTLGIDLDGDVEMAEYKELVQFHEGAFQNFLEFSRQFLNHVNEYTGRRIADEPAMAWLSFVNEGNLGNKGFVYFEKHPFIMDAWKKWLKEKKAVDKSYAAITDALPKNGIWRSQNDSQYCAIVQFMRETETRFARRVTDFLRNEIKCRALTTNMNNWHYPVAFQLPRAADYDYVDDHFYVDHPNFLEQRWRLPSRCPNTNPILGERMGAQALTVRRVLNRPFTITEYNYSGPGRFRGVGGIALGTAGALQNWAGLWRFAWSHGIYGVKTSQRKMGYFDMSGDPLSTAAERASICLFLRRDLQPLKKTYAVVLPPKKLAQRSDYQPKIDVPWTWLSWYAKIGNVVADQAPEGAVSAGAYPEVFKKTSDEIRAAFLPGVTKDAMPVAGDGAVTVDSQTGSFILATPRTSGGFAEKGVVKTDLLTADIGDTAATVWVSALDDKAINESDHLLLTHLTDVQNTNIHYADRALTILLNWGKLPHLMRVGTAKVSMAAAPGNWTVHVLASDGSRRYTVPCTYENGKLNFTAAVNAKPDGASYLYEIVRQ